MQKLAEVCIRRPVFATMIVLALVVVGSRQLLPARRRPLPVRRSAHGERAHRAARRLRRGDGDPGHAEARGGGQHHPGHHGAALDLRAPAPRSSSSPSTSAGPIDVAAQDVRDKVADRRRATCPATSGRRSSPSSTTTRRRSSRSRVSGNRALRELTELADKTVKVAARARAGRRRGAARRRPAARRQRLGRRRPAGRLPDPDHRGARRHRAPERRRARRQRHGGPAASSRCGPWAASPTRGRSTTWWWPPSTARRSACATSARPRTAPRSSARPPA